MLIVRSNRPPDIVLEVPLPPAVLRANSRAHWATRSRARRGYSLVVAASAWKAWQDRYRKKIWCDPAWPRARVRYTWRHAGRAPDLANLGGHTKVLQDLLCCAPATGRANHAWYAGIVADDAGITPEYRMLKVAHRSDEGVTVELWRE